MAIFKRKELPKLLEKIDKGLKAQVFLIHGERYLCQEAAESVVRHLLPDEKIRLSCLTSLDGDKEDPVKTLNELRTFSLFGGRRVIRISDSRLLLSRVVARTLWEKTEQSYGQNDLRAASRYLDQLIEAVGLSDQDFLDLDAQTWKKKLGFERPAGNLDWAEEVLGNPARSSSEGSPSSAKKDLPEIYLEALQEGLPEGNALILVAETADKRKKIYKHFAEHEVVVDLSVEMGASKKAVEDQGEVLAELVNRTLGEFSKKIDRKALDLLLERVGFHPVAARLESEKLALYLEDRDTATVEDLDQVVGRTREEAIFELTEAVSSQDLARSLIIAGRLQDHGTHPLAIIGALRNHFRKMLLISALQKSENPSYSPGVSYPAFQSGYLERLKKSREQLPEELSAHPYALYMLFKKTEKFSQKFLTDCLERLLNTEQQLKGSGLPNRIILDDLFIRLLAKAA